MKNTLTAIPAALAGVMMATFTHAGQNDVGNDLLRELAGGAQDSISRHDFMQDFCDNLPAELAANSSFNVTTNFVAAGNECIVLSDVIPDFTVNFNDFNDDGTMTGTDYQSSLTPSEYVSALITRRSTIQDFCNAVNDDVAPVLYNAGVVSGISAELSETSDACWVIVNDSIASFMAEYTLNDDGSMRDGTIESAGHDILDSLPKSDREIARDLLPGLLPE